MRRKDFDRDKFLREDWPTALESGEFQQAKGVLFDGEGYCCLGVACELLSRLRLLPRRGWQRGSLLPAAATKILRLGDSADYYANASDKRRRVTRPAADLVQLNDGGESFEQIAEIIRSKAEQGLFWEDADVQP